MIDPSAFAASLDRRDPAGVLAAFRAAVDGWIVFTTSFGVEDQAITHMIANAGLAIDIATLDTGRLFPETYGVWAETERRYGLRIASVAPQTAALEALVERQGVNGFYDSIDARKSCCGVRKVEPLGRLLAGASGWITGLRADQSATRATAALVERHPTLDLLKLNPLIGWSRDDAVRFTAAHDVPISPLHAKGFLSIGCAPCTRALRPGEPERAGRWWWEDEAAKECGLHVGADGRLRRTATTEAAA